MQPQSQTVDNPIQRFLNGTRFAVAGASKDRSKYGNKVLRALLDAGKDVVAVHPVETNVEGVPAHPMVSQVPYPIESLSIVTPPPVTERVVADAIKAGVKSIWIQPGAEHDGAIAQAQQAGIEVIAHGPCVLVALRTHRARDQ